jgi:fumarate hydratase subunit alpha/L(+)-tartrate dehydratase alpha subunit
MKVDLPTVEDAAKELYVRALKVLPPDVKQGFARLVAQETAPIAQRVLATMVQNIAVAENTDNLLCRDTGVPIYNVWIGTGVDVDGRAQGGDSRCARATHEHPLRSSIVHPLTRKNDQSSCGIEVPVIHIDFKPRPTRSRSR